MGKQKVNTTSSMKEKGDSASSHYRSNAAKYPLATKFVSWDVEPLESLSGSKVYILREKLYRVKRMSREEKNLKFTLEVQNCPI